MCCQYLCAIACCVPTLVDGVRIQDLDDDDVKGQDMSIGEDNRLDNSGHAERSMRQAAEAAPEVHKKDYPLPEAMQSEEEMADTGGSGVCSAVRLMGGSAESASFFAAVGLSGMGAGVIDTFLFIRREYVPSAALIGPRDPEGAAFEHVVSPFYICLCWLCFVFREVWATMENRHVNALQHMTRYTHVLRGLIGE